MGYSTVLVIDDPATKNYSNFFQAVLNQLPPSLPGIDVLVTQRVKQTKELNYILSSVYGSLRSCANEQGFPFTFGINVLVNSLRSDWDFAFVPASESGNGVVADKTRAIETEIDNRRPPDFQSFSEHQFPVSAVGGTFDHLHDGHKILLSAAAFATSTHLIVGITGQQMLSKKKFAEAMESLDRRIGAVTKYLKEILPESVTFSIYQIDDVCGPTGFVRDIDALVISEETRKGATFVNDYRRKQGFSELEVLSVDVLGSDGGEQDNWKGKISSTDMREEELKRRSKRQRTV
ncbi:hypothetical protein FDK38_001627 [Candidozyma auris]|nr:hypothetical protein FDK38_001627 [[Candida] auris]